MSSATVVLKVNQGEPEDQRLVFHEPGHCVIGRAQDCDVRLPMDFAHSDVSRHHCLFEIDPPHVRVRDLGSRNGTFVNGELIGRRLPQQAAEVADAGRGPSRTLHTGDEVRVGITFVRVAVMDEDIEPDYCL